MKKSDMAAEISRREGTNPGDAADRLDRVVNRIVRDLRQGKAARLPGLGTLKPGKPWTFQPEEPAEKK